jgi:hypothetical protein
MVMMRWVLDPAFGGCEHSAKFGIGLERIVASAERPQPELSLLEQTLKLPAA